MNDCRSGHQLYSSFALRSRATSSARRFSIPSPRSFENGRLLGSAQTRSTRGDSAANAPYNESVAIRLRQREDIKCSTGRTVLGQILHRIHEPQCASAVLRIQFCRHDHAGPSAYAGQYGDVLLAIRPFISDRLADDSGTYFELPEGGAVMR